MKNTSFLMGLLCAFLIMNGISSVFNVSIVWIGIIELLVAGFLSYPHLMRVWNTTGRAFFISILKIENTKKNEDVNR